MLIKNLRLVEVEIHSYCNRQCSFCPNSYIDRHSFVKELDEEIYISLLKQLKKGGFKGKISYSRYNEPFSQPLLFMKRILQAKTILPGIKLVTNTNGDYDTGAFRDLLNITEMDYDHNKELFKIPGYQVMRLGKINNRGGALNLKKEQRNKPCYEPKYFVGIDYDGSVTPCCNIRHDVPEHKNYILGNLKNNKLEEILNSENSVDFRSRAASGINWILPEPCKYCQKEPGRYTKDE